MHLKLIPLSLILAALLLMSCNRSSEEKSRGNSSTTSHATPLEASSEAHHEGVVFKEGQGLEIPEETCKSLDLKTVEVAERSLKPSHHVRVRVFREIPPKSSSGTRTVHACGFAIGETASAIQPMQKVMLKLHGQPQAHFEGTITKVDFSMKEALGSPEVILEIADPRNELKTGVALDAAILTSGELNVMSVPKEAVLHTATGTYVYVVNGKNLLRTPVTVGFQDEDHVEIREGLYSGDQVAFKPVMSLWVAELQAVNAGVSCCVVGH